MSNSHFTEKDNLRIINEMVDNTRSQVLKTSAYNFLLWGYLCSAVTLTVIVAAYTINSPRQNMLWLLIPTLGMLLSVYFNHRWKTPRTHAQPTLIWRYFGAYQCALTLICLYYQLVQHQLVWGIFFFMSLPILGAMTIATGICLNVRSLAWGGFIACVLGTVYFCEAPSLSNLPNYWLFTYLFSFFAMMIVPGHLMLRQLKSSCCKL